MAEARVVDRFRENPCGLLVGVETHGVLGSHEVQPPLGPTVQRPRSGKLVLGRAVFGRGLDHHHQVVRRPFGPLHQGPSSVLDRLHTGQQLSLRHVVARLA